MNNDNFVLGFVAPFGEFYECLPFEHIKLANDLLEKMYKAQNANSVDRLCRLGWIVLEKDFVGFIDVISQYLPFDKFSETVVKRKQRKDASISAIAIRQMP